MKRRTIALIAVAIALFALSAASAAYKLNRAEAAIDAIGAVHFNEESRAAIDQAVAACLALDENLHLDARVSNLAALNDAKAEYVRLAIKTAAVAEQRKSAEGYSDGDIREKLDAARAAFDAYCTGDDGIAVPNYDDLLELEARYAALDAAPATSSDAPAPESGERPAVISLC